MAKHNDLGKEGEKVAVDFLQKKGYKILEINWRHRRSEIDVICMDGDILVFVEVKARSSTYFGNPESFVSARKEELMADAASVYMESIGHTWEIRFDVLAIVFHNHIHQSIDHFKDAFFPGWEK